MNQVSFNKVRLSLAVLLCLCATSMVNAKVKLPALISDGMVLQREQPIKVWGTADAGESVQVKFLKNATPTGVKGGKLKATYTATADENGQWSLTLPAMKPGGPYILQVNDIELKDILVGDVWLCSGQSNMELPVSRVTDMSVMKSPLTRTRITATESTQSLQLPCTANGLAGLRCLETTDAGKRHELLRSGLFLCQSHV